MPALFAVTLFLSATLLFMVQPMIAKMILPKLGGTPAVWNTCMVFFQAALLAGYAYAHATTAWLGVRRQALVHTLVVLLPVLVLPIAVSEAWVPPTDGYPVPAVLGLLALSVGLPFLVVSTSAPLLQKWFAGTGHASAQDPYFLYAASNFGSILALIAYPVVLERHLKLVHQSRLWEAGYYAFAVLSALCAFRLWRSPITEKETRRQGDKETEGAANGSASLSPALRVSLSPARRLHWVVLAFVPSSLMLGVTTYLSTDIASIPLIWVVPLALYLLSFILVFSRLPSFVHTLVVLTLPVLVVVQMFMTYTEPTQRTAVLIGLHLLTLFTAAMCCHGELARRRPDTSHLTEFYLCMSLGGVLGGMFNALVAPLIFKTVMEYQLVMVLACIVTPSLEGLALGPVARAFDSVLALLVGRDTAQDWRRREITPRWLDGLLPLLLGLFTIGLLFRLDEDHDAEFLNDFHDWLGDIGSRLRLVDHVPSLAQLRSGLQFGVPILLCYFFVSRPVRFGLGLGAIMLAFTFYSAEVEKKSVVYRDRSFFGVLKLERSDRDLGNCHRLVHGTTLHGMQELGADNKPLRFADPLTYYHRDGPVGRLFAALKKANDTRPLAFIGLGTGTLACYAQPLQEVTFYEIDPAVERIARNMDFFTYVTDAEERKVDLRVVHGDARLSLRDKARNHHYGLIVVDAFSSDAIPVHLITREALKLYLDKIAGDGVIAFHISNRYLDLRPVLANLAEDASLAAIVEHDDEDKKIGKFATTWVLLARNEGAFQSLADDIRGNSADEDRHWKRLEEDLKDEESLRRNVGLWTDDYSNILSIFSWK
jgi:hypothetical protein